MLQEKCRNASEVDSKNVPFERHGIKNFTFMDLNLKPRSVTNQFEFIFEKFLMTHTFAFHIRYKI